MRISESEVITSFGYLHYNEDEGIRLAVKGVGLAVGTIKGFDEDRRIALITFDSGGGGVTVPLSPGRDGVDARGNRYEKWALGDEIAFVGYMPNASPTTPIATFGRISLIENLTPGDFLIGHAYANVRQAMLGGAVFNKRGDLIGMLLDSNDGRSLFLMAAEIGEVIGDLRAGAGFDEE